jgi:hypothetical protein
MDPREIEQNAEHLVGKAERNEKITAELNGMDFHDRLKVVQRMQDINKDHRQHNSNLPEMEISTQSDQGEQRVVDIQMKTERSWMDPRKWFGYGQDKTDVYDPPHSELGQGLLGGAADRIHSRNQRLNDVLAELDKQNGRR